MIFAEKEAKPSTVFARIKTSVEIAIVVQIEQAF
jgi:hypothetical protein